MPEFVEGEGFKLGRGVGLPNGPLGIVLHPPAKYRCQGLRDSLARFFEFEGIRGRQGEADATITSQNLGAALVLELVPHLLNRI